MPKATDDELNSIIKSIESGQIDSETRQTLMKYNGWLCHSNSASHFGRNYEPTCETVRLHLLRTFMDELERKNAETQKWVITLAVAALIAAVVQTTVAIRGELREEAKTQQGAFQPPQLPKQEAVPIHARPPFSGQTMKKVP